VNPIAPSQTSKTRRHLLFAAGLGLVGVVAWFALKQRSAKTPTTETPAPSFEQTYPGLDLADPVPSFEVLRYAYDTGGDERTRQLAIVWLDDHAATERPPAPELEAWLMDMLQAKGHPDWDVNFRMWLFNSAFNVFHHGQDQEAFTRYLHDLARHDEVRTIRIYAIQHLGIQRMNGRLSGILADEVRESLQEMSKLRDGGVAGMAVARLAEWNDPENMMDSEVLTQAIAIASDPSQPVDARVTALHAAGADALALSRELAKSTNEPVILRKSAIACIGNHGDAEDVAKLEILGRESSRIAQASQPALRKIRDRLTHPNPPVLVPF
jgi:hypothetical protein